MELRRFLTSLLATVVFFHSIAAQADTWFFDFGSSGQVTPNYNNITNPGISTVAGLINSQGQTTGAALSITIPFNTGSNTGGTTTPAAGVEFPASATRDSFFGDRNTAPTSQLQLSGLDPAVLYDFTFFASRMGVTDNRQAQYRLNGANVKTAFLNASANTSQVAAVTGVQPTQSGTIVMDLAPGPENNNSSALFYLGAMKVVSVSTPVTCGADDPSLDDTLTAYPAGSAEYTLGHWLYRPATYSQSPCKKYPLLIWLHGIGERCQNGSLSILHKSSLNSPGYQILQRTAYSNGRPFLNGLILEPQTCDGWGAANIGAMITYVQGKFRVDEQRIYVTGLSLGAGGTWSYAAGNPTTVAAIVPIAGPETALSSIHKASHVPTWAFHNYNDTNLATPPLKPETELFRCYSHTHRVCTEEHIDRMIPFATTRVMQGYSANDGATSAGADRTASLGHADNLLLPTKWTWVSSRVPQDSSSKTIMTIFAVSGHSGWAPAYGMQEMWEWLYAQRRQPPPTLKVNSPLITPTNAGVSSGAQVVITAKIALGGVALSQVSADLKSLGGSNVAPMTFMSATQTYELRHVLPVAGLKAGTKGVGITAVDQTGNRTVNYVTITLNP